MATMKALQVTDGRDFVLLDLPHIWTDWFKQTVISADQLIVVAGPDLASLRTGLMVGAPCPIEVMKKVMERMHMRDVGIAYGMTETSPVSTQTAVDDPVMRKVGTVGRLEVTPNSPNVIPGKVTFSVELRDVSETVLKTLGEDIRQRAAAVAHETRTEPPSGVYLIALSMRLSRIWRTASSSAMTKYFFVIMMTV